MTLKLKVYAGYRQPFWGWNKDLWECKSLRPWGTKWLPWLCGGLRMYWISWKMCQKPMENHQRYTKWDIFGETRILCPDFETMMDHILEMRPCWPWATSQFWYKRCQAFIAKSLWPKQDCTPFALAAIFFYLIQPCTPPNTLISMGRNSQEASDLSVRLGSHHICDICLALNASIGLNSQTEVKRTHSAWLVYVYGWWTPLFGIHHTSWRVGH